MKKLQKSSLPATTTVDNEIQLLVNDLAIIISYIWSRNRAILIHRSKTILIFNTSNRVIGKVEKGSVSVKTGEP